jgi:hypothetical protein
MAPVMRQKRPPDGMKPSGVDFAAGDRFVGAA